MNESWDAVEEIHALDKLGWDSGIQEQFPCLVTDKTMFWYDISTEECQS